jgi:uncharacterized membrane protein
MVEVPMARVVKSIRIDAPREHVFALATDVTRQPDWTTFVKEGLIISGDGKSAGTTDRTVIQVGPRATKTESVWTEYNSGERFARRATSGMQMEERMLFTPVGNGTDVQWAVSYTPPLGILGKLMDVFMMNRVYQNEIEGSLERLKAELET